MSSPLIDTHCHLDEQGFDTDRDEIIARSIEAGLTGIISLGTTLESSRLNIGLAQQYEIVHAAIGIHPNYVAAANGTDWQFVEELATAPEVVAIGETGLDRYWDHSPIELQIDYFHRHIALSRTANKPFAIHCRDAEEDVLRELTAAAAEGPVQAVMHSFCGSAATAEACLEMGLMISFAGMLTFKRNDELREIASRIPHDRLMVETDAPYLSPEPKRGKRNEPSHVQHTADVLASVLGMSPDELRQLTTNNAMRFFGLSKS